MLLFQQDGSRPLECRTIMIRTLLIYLAVLTFAEGSMARPAQVDTTQSQVEQTFVFEPMTPVHADGTALAPKIMDFTKDPDADRTTPNPRRLKKALANVER